MPKKTATPQPVHPGEILREDLMEPLGISINALARALRVPPARIHEIVKERRGITADTALRLARYFGSTPDFWMNLQGTYDLQVAQRDLRETIDREVLPRDAA